MISHKDDRIEIDRAIPDGFDLADEVIRRVTAGTLSLAPLLVVRHQAWATEPRLLPERTPGAARDTYRKQLREPWKGIAALQRIEPEASPPESGGGHSLVRNRDALAGPALRRTPGSP